MKKEYFKPKSIVVSIDSSSILVASDGPENGGSGIPGTNGHAKRFYEFYEDWMDEEF